MTDRLVQYRRLSEGKWHVALLARRAYRIAPGEPPTPLSEVGALDDEEETAWKPFTDVVFRADLYPAHGKRTEVTAWFEVAGRGRSVRATGRRRFTGVSGGTPDFGAAEPFDRVPLAYALCYGGFDAEAHARLGVEERWARDLSTIVNMPVEDTSALTYPRNRRGLGYFVGEFPRSAIGREVPQLDDPEDPLEPERVVRRGADDWLDAPAPAALDWTEPADFPRCALLGFAPAADPPRRPIREVVSGAIQQEQLHQQHEVPPPVDLRALQGAAPGLATLRLHGGEIARATHAHPTGHEWVITVPRDRPGMSITAPGCPSIEVEPELLSLRIDLRAGRMVAAWSGSLEVAGRYPDDEFAAFTLAVR